MLRRKIDSLQYNWKNCDCVTEKSTNPSFQRFLKKKKKNKQGGGRLFGTEQYYSSHITLGYFRKKLLQFSVLISVKYFDFPVFAKMNYHKIFF